jgi:beta-phosphoglucomutase-like phosphatase (HAD superfamily)
MFVFDFDGVLVDSSALCLELLRRFTRTSA